MLKWDRFWNFNKEFSAANTVICKTSMSVDKPGVADYPIAYFEAIAFAILEVLALEAIALAIAVAIAGLPLALRCALPFLKLMLTASGTPPAVGPT